MFQNPDIILFLSFSLLEKKLSGKNGSPSRVVETERERSPLRSLGSRRVVEDREGSQEQTGSKGKKLRSSIADSLQDRIDQALDSKLNNLFSKVSQLVESATSFKAGQDLLGSNRRRTLWPCRLGSPDGNLLNTRFPLIGPDIENLRI
jgi:hypothetical protein